MPRFPVGTDATLEIHFRHRNFHFFIFIIIGSRKELKRLASNNKFSGLGGANGRLWPAAAAEKL